MSAPLKGRSTRLTIHPMEYLTRALAGSPQIMTLLISYPTEEACPDIAWLDQRLQLVQERMPYLSLRLRKEGDPNDIVGWHWQEVAPWTISDLYRSFHVDDKAEQATLAELYEGSTRDVADKVNQHLILERERARMQQDHVWRLEPLWQFTRYTVSSSDRVYLAFSLNHIITDGKGFANLLEACMRPVFDFAQEGPFGERLAPVTATPPSPPVEPETTTEHAVNSATASAAATPPAWPETLYPFKQTPCSFPEAKRIIHISPAITTALKDLRRAKQGTSTLTPSLYIAWMMAIQYSIRKHSSPDIHKLYGDNLPHFPSATLMSKRDVRVGDSPVWGFGTAVLVHYLRFKPTDDYWELVRLHAAALSLSLAKAKARVSSMTTLDLALAASNKLRTPENILADLMGPTPYALPTGFSNLTYVPLPAGAEDMLFSQDANPLLPGPCLTAGIGHEAGTRFVPGWREGLLFDQPTIRDAERAFHRLLQRVIRGESSVGALLAD